MSNRNFNSHPWRKLKTDITDTFKFILNIWKDIIFIGKFLFPDPICRLASVSLTMSPLEMEKVLLSNATQLPC